MDRGEIVGHAADDGQRWLSPECVVKEDIEDTPVTALKKRRTS